MGTINYGTSEYITLGIMPYDVDDIMSDPDFVDFALENGEKDLYDYAHETINNYYDDDWKNVETILKKYKFYYFNISIMPGYYEGLYIYIEHEYPDCYDSYDEKKEVQKEITQIKKFLLDCAGCGFVACSPGWCTRYSDYKDTLKEISTAIKAMREEVKRTPTLLTYNRETA